MKKIKQLVDQIDQLSAKKAQLLAQHDAIAWGPNMPRELSAQGRKIGNEMRAISKAIEILQLDIVNVAMAAYSTTAKAD